MISAVVRVRPSPSRSSTHTWPRCGPISNSETFDAATPSSVCLESTSPAPLPSTIPSTASHTASVSSRLALGSRRRDTKKSWLSNWSKSTKGIRVTPTAPTTAPTASARLSVAYRHLRAPARRRV